MIEAFNVSKKFDDIQAVDSISLCIKEGSVFGLIGTNGAGKSTFMRILSGVLKPDSGSIKIDDEDVFELWFDFSPVISGFTGISGILIASTPLLFSKFIDVSTTFVSFVSFNELFLVTP